MSTSREMIPYGHMVHDYYVGRVRDFSDARQQSLEAVRTRAQAEELVRDVRRRVRRCFGPLPERTPLRPRLRGVLERDGYRIEKVIFDSRPGFPVTANLYLPTGLDGKLPGAIGTCGHSAAGKAEVNYQRFCQGLVRRGFVVLIYDPLGQGERKQFADLSYPGFVSSPCREHNMLGNAMQLCGDFLGTWRAWDGIRALDYLLTRPEVDPARIGVTGNSGGGTLASYLNVLDNRYAMAAPSCFVTSYRRNIENELPADSEQNPPGFLAAGLEMADFFIAQAPRPTLLLGQRNDFFDPRGVEETYREIRRIYRLLGEERQIARFIGPDPHGFWQANREAMYGFFCDCAGVKASASESEATPETEADLHCTDSGMVVDEPRPSRRVFDFTADAAKALRSKRTPPVGQALSARVAKLLACGADRSIPYFRILRTAGDAGPQQVLSRYAVESEPGISVTLFRPGAESVFHLTGSGPARLYLPHLGTRSDWQAGLVPAVDQDVPLFMLDPRGCGESRPLTGGMEADFFTPYGSDFLAACCGSFLAAPYLGGAVRDVLAVIRLLRARGFTEVRLEGRGMGALKAAFAGLLAGEAVSSLCLFNPLLSYHELTQAPFYRWPFSTLLPGVLKSFDLPDVYRALSKRLELIDPWNADMECWNETEARVHARKLGIPSRVLRFQA